MSELPLFEYTPPEVERSLVDGYRRISSARKPSHRTSRRRTTLVLALLLASCAEPPPEIAPPVDEVPARTGALVVQGNTSRGSASLAFGTFLAPGVATAELRLSNVGIGPIVVGSMEVVGPEVPGLRVVGPLPSQIAPGEEASVLVEWTAEADADLASSLRIESTDGASSQALAPLRGIALGGRLTVVPTTTLAIPSTPVGCTALATGWLGNAGRRDVAISQAALTSVDGHQDLTWPGAAALPWVLAPGGSLPLDVLFSPQVSGPHVGSLTLETDAAGQTSFVVPVVAEAEALEQRVDTFVQGPLAFDLLVVIANSGSLQSYAVLDAAMGQLAAATVLVGLDAQLGVVSTDVGDSGVLQGFPAYVGPGTSDPVSAFRANANLGGGGSGTEQGFASAWLAFSADNLGPGGPNEGFRRPEVPLRILFVVNEAEQSAGPFWSYDLWLDALEGLVEDASLLTLSDVSGGDLGCASSTQGAGPGVDYVLASAATGGVSVSVCAADWMDQLLASDWLAVDPPARVVLDGPVAEILEVRIDGTPLLSGWTHAPSSDVVAFAPDSVPPEGASIEVTWLRQTACAVP